MNKPHWEKLHDWWKEDFAFWREQRLFMLDLLKKRPGDKQLLNAVKNIDKIIRFHQKEYQSIYGCRFSYKLLEEE